jgi:4-hydroxyacetophenone monooxygenase
MRYVMGCIEPMADNGVRALRVRREVFEQYNQRIDEELKHLVWSHPRVRTWYKNASGRIIINSPWRLLDYWRLTLRPDLRDYDLEHSTKET